MAAGSGTVTIKILGDAKSALASFAEVGAGAEGMGGKLKSVGTAAIATGAVIATAVIGAGVELYKIGASFDEAYDKIRVGTGATGDALNALKDDFRNVVQDVPTDFGKAGDAITAVVSKLGTDAGPGLDKLAEQFLELSRITGTDLAGNIDVATQALLNWNVPVTEQSTKLDQLFRASQLTGVSFATLAGGLEGAGVQMRDAGLTFDQSTAILASLARAGIEAGDVLPALSKGMALAAKEGKSAAEVFGTVVYAIKTAPDDVAAAGIALDNFGAKAGPKFGALIREGKLDFDGLMQAIGSGSDTILGAGKDTQDFSEKWNLFKNRVLVALEPVAMRVFDGMGKLMDKLPSIAAKVSSAFDRIRPTLEKIGSVISSVLTPVIQFFIDHWEQLRIALIVVGGILAVLAVAVLALSAVFIGTFVVGVVAVAAAVVLLIQGFQWLWDKLEPVRDLLGKVASIATDVLAVAFGYVSDAVSTATGVLVELWNKAEPVRAFLADTFRTALDLLRSAIDALRGAWDALWSSIQRVIDAAKTAIDLVSKVPGVSGITGGSVADHIPGAPGGPPAPSGGGGAPPQTFGTNRYGVEHIHIHVGDTEIASVIRAYNRRLS